ncbi:MAG: hypothetical protein M3O61_03665 [Gemmatimonadota bacterium]|nr:hypothetical protein [Gemmatimonadota bacterium]
MTDWNWFFSSLAQSVAALVGVTAAFLIARLVNSQSDFAHARARTEELLVGADRLRDAAKARYFDWYIEQALEVALSTVKSIVRKIPPDAPEDYYALYGFPSIWRRRKFSRKSRGR